MILLNLLIINSYVIYFNVISPPSGPQKPLTINELGAFFVEDPLMSIPNPFWIKFEI